MAFTAETYDSRLDTGESIGRVRAVMVFQNLLERILALAELEC
jgi:hypothetical protein